MTHIDFTTELRRIESEINRFVPPDRYRGHGYVNEVRRLTQPEWRLVKRAIAAGYPAVVGYGNFGMGVAICVFAQVEPTYPGVPIEPECLISVGSKQVPGKMKTLVRETGGVFDLFMALVSTPENIALCKRDDLSVPKLRHHYEY